MKMKISHRGLRLIAGYEGFRPEPYICAGGCLTIGYGHRILPGEKFTRITEVEADEILRKDVERAERAVERLVKVEINQEIFDALVSFTFNLGERRLANSTLLKFLNSGDYYNAIIQLSHWDNAGGKEQSGLEARRAEEAMFFAVGAYKLGKILQG